MAERENTKRTEQEQDERAGIAALSGRFTQVIGRACALTFLYDKIVIQPATNYQPSNKDCPLFFMLSPDLSPWAIPTNTHASISRLQPHLLTAVILDPFQTSSRPQHNTEKTPIAGEIVLLLSQMGSLTALQFDISMVSLNTGQPWIPSPSILSGQEHSLLWDTS